MLEADSLVLQVDARAIVDVARRAILAETSANIRAGKRPDGGPQRPLSRRAAADPQRESTHRGFRTGHFADELRATPIKGDEQRAESVVRPPTDRNVFVATEAKRGVHYLGLSGPVAAAVDAAINDAVAAMLDGRKVEAEQGEPTGGEERGQ